MRRHKLDPYPITKDKAPLYINEPWLIDESLGSSPLDNTEPENQRDNIRVYIPLDLNKKAILRRLMRVISKYGGVTEVNESEYSLAVKHLVSQVEIYDQLWYVRHMPEVGNHSLEAIELVREMIVLLETISDCGAEGFLSETIELLRMNYL